MSLDAGVANACGPAFEAVSPTTASVSCTGAAGAAGVAVVGVAAGAAADVVDAGMGVPWAAAGVGTAFCLVAR
jgi:hypothetical protein